MSTPKTENVDILRDKWNLSPKPVKRCRVCGAEVGGGKRVHGRCARRVK